MIGAGVLVKITGPDPKGLKIVNRSFYSFDNGKTSLSASGFLIGSHQVLTSASLLAPFIINHKELIEGTEIHVSIESSIDDSNRSKLVWVKAELDDVYHTEEKCVENARKLLDGRNLPTQRGIDATMIARLTIPSSKTMLSINHVHNNNKGKIKFAKHIKRGSKILIHSSPYGLVSPEVFQNSLTNGIISNIVSDHALYLTDARCLVGSEGAPVFLADAPNELVGMVMPSIPRPDGTSIELGVILPARAFQHCFVSGLLLEEETEENDEAVYNNNTSSFCFETVVLINAGSSWGSGVVVSSQGHILTCAHVVQYSSKDVRVSFRDSANIQEREIDYVGKVLFFSQGIIDVALIKVERLCPTFMKPSLPFLRNSQPESIVAVGHALFHPKTQFSSSCTSGIISRFVYDYKSQPILIQTCAKVFRGHSGGMLIHNNRLLGILTSNARHSGDGTIIPDINFSIYTGLDGPIGQILASSQWNLFSTIPGCRVSNKTEEDTELERIWKLEVTSTHPQYDEDQSSLGGGGGGAILGGGQFSAFLKKFTSKI